MGTELLRPEARAGDAVPVGGASASATVIRAGRAARALFPSGRPLPATIWQRRHRLMLALLWAHVPAIALMAVAVGERPLHGAIGAGLVAAVALVAGWDRLGRRARASLVSVGLFGCSAMLVHLSGGYVEAHFHFFIIVSVVALYQDWTAFLVGVGFVVLHHGLVGTLNPASVYNHPAAQAHPWRWAAIHGAFVLAACGTSLTSWRLKEEERARAETDALTGLPNRGAVMTALDEAVIAPTAGPVSLLVVDLDGLKTINDTQGHAAGDAVLRAAAAVLRDTLRVGDVAGRYGGDEFLVVLNGTDRGDAHALADRLVARAAMFAQDEVGALQFSVGIATAPHDGCAARDLLLAADGAMYEAKRGGGGSARPRTTNHAA